MTQSKGKIMKRFILALVLSVFSIGANASLISRLGGAAVYDTDLDITWLADANAGAGSAFDDGASSTDGRMSWASATAWASSLTISGVSGWRLPTTAQPDPTCSSQTPDVPPLGSGLNCSGGEMGHLFYDELSGTAGSSILVSGDPDLTLFTNILDFFYWSSTEFVFDTNRAWHFFFAGGVQGKGGKSAALSAWAVNDGDVFAPVPIPAAFWLFGSALGLLGWMRRGYGAAPRWECTCPEYVTDGTACEHCERARAHRVIPPA